MVLRKDKDLIIFLDMVNGIVGSYYGKEEAEADNPDLQGQAYQILYVPLVDFNKSWAKSLRTLPREKSAVVKTSTVYPKSGIIGPTSPGDRGEEGTPNKMVIATQDQYGRSPFMRREIGKEFDKNIADLQADVSNLQKESTLKDMDLLAQEDQQKRSDENPRASQKKTDEDFDEMLDEMEGN